MVSVAWRADPEALASAARAFEASEDPSALLEAAGRLVALGVSPARDERGRAAALALSHEAREGAFDALEGAAVAIRTLLDRRLQGAGEVDPEQLARGVRGALGIRDRVELQILGATAILGQRPAFGPEQESALMLFEALVRPELWRLTEANEARREAVGWMAPARRAAFWWWHEGADVAPHAVSSMAAVAHLVARFPAAAEALTALVAAQRAWDEAGSAARASSSVVSLGAWVQRRAATARGASARGGGVALAAATRDEEIALVEHADYQISWCPPDTLVVDLVADRAPGARPSLRLADGVTVASEPVPGTEERFQIVAGASILEQGRAVLVLPLAAGTVELPLPPDGR